jgi:hypothetical protein
MDAGLERKATLREDKVEVKSQPFGGAIRILDLDTIHDMIGDFHFDSERSRTEQDFRLFIRPSTGLCPRVLYPTSADNDLFPKRTNT